MYCVFLDIKKMNKDIITKYNVPTPRYTSYPPANFFYDIDQKCFVEQLVKSNSYMDDKISFYFHIPFCHHICHYCGCNSYPMRSSDFVDEYMSAMHKEIDLLSAYIDKSRKISQIHFGGGSPTSIPLHYLKEIIEHLKDVFDILPYSEVAVECHPGYLNENDWIELCDIGFNRLSLGIQDFNDDVLRVVNRKPSLMDIEDIFSILRHNGKKINLDFIYGLPMQTVDSFMYSMQKAVSLKPDRLVTFSYAHVPSVNKRQTILEKYGICPTETKKTIFDSAYKYLLNNGYVDIGLDHFVLPDDELYTALQNGDLHRNFQGYCTKETTAQVYAVGVTAISQLNSAYIQNTKDIKGYIEDINKGCLPVKKGYVLNEKQMFTREIIESLMCNYKLNWQNIAEKLSVTLDELTGTISCDDQKLKMLSDDGIIMLSDEGIEVTDEGKLFVRNVASAFDFMLKGSNKVFSKPI